MRLAWIVYPYNYNPMTDTPQIIFDPPDVYQYSRVIPIVYAELKEKRKW